MKEKFSNLNSYQKTVIVSTIVALIATIVLTVLSIVKVLEFFVLIGTVLGALLVIISYLLLSKIESSSNEDMKLKASIGVVSSRLFLLLGLSILEVVLELKANVKLYNVFGFLGGYLGCTLISFVFVTGERKC